MNFVAGRSHLLSLRIGSFSSDMRCSISPPFCIRYGQTPHLLLRPRIGTSVFQSTGHLKKGRVLGTQRWRSEAGKEFAESPSDPSGPVTSVDVIHTGQEPVSRVPKGFGATPAISSSKPSKENPAKDKKASTRRRTIPAKPVLVPQTDPQVQQLENAFVLSWVFLGVVILMVGVVLAASGFLPEEWDDILVKYVYPSFTPSVGLFLAGAAIYGLYRYFQGSGKPS